MQRGLEDGISRLREGATFLTSKLRLVAPSTLPCRAAAGAAPIACLHKSTSQPGTLLVSSEVAVHETGGVVRGGLDDPGHGPELPCV